MSVSANSLYLYLYEYLVVRVYLHVDVSGVVWVFVCISWDGFYLVSVSFFSSLFVDILSLHAFFCCIKWNTLCILYGFYVNNCGHCKHQIDNEPNDTEHHYWCASDNLWVLKDCGGKKTPTDIIIIKKKQTRDHIFAYDDLTPWNWRNFQLSLF